jgi:phosphoribosylanthranilate isomerase
MLIKICGIGDPKTALFAAQNGANFIGMVLTPGFKRSVTVPQAEKIVEAARNGGAEPVAAFVGATAEEIELTCRQLGINIVQLYEFEGELPSHLKRFFVVESHQPGSGKMIDPQTFSTPTQKPWFLAGGLNPQNVKEMIQRYRPDGVDVSSGVEREHKKNHALILKFISEVKSCE